MTRKSLIITVLGCTGCSAAAFWAGLHWQTGDSQSASGDRQRAAIAAGGTMASGRDARAAGKSDAARDGRDDTPLSKGRPISELNPEETKVRLKEILAMEDPIERMAAYLEFMKGVKGDEQIAAAMEALTENYSGRERGREFSMFMTRWAKESPEAALAWTQTHDDWRSQWGTQTALSIWAQSNPDKAIEWAAAHPPKNKDEGNFHMAAVVGGIAKYDPDRAGQLAQSMDRSEARGRAMETVLDAFTKQRGDEAAKSMVMALEEGPYKNGIMSRFADRLASKDAKAAAAWAASLPEGEAKPRVVTEVIDEWAQRDPNDAGNWLNNLPKSPAMDEPRERFAWKVQERDPEAAIAWAGTITDEKRRNETSYRLVREWMNREPESAKAWVSTSTLPDDMKERLLNRRRG